MGTLQELCVAVLKEHVPLSVELLCGLPLPVTEELAVCLSPSQLFELEERLRNIGTSESTINDCTERAWRHHCQLRRYTAHEESWECPRIPQYCAVRQARELWLQSYINKYLLHHFYTWKPDLPGTHARMFLFSAREHEPLEQFPPLSFEEFVDHTASVVKHAKAISVRSKALLGMSAHPVMVEALKTNLLAVKVDCWRFFDKTDAFLEFLQVLGALIGDGHLKSISLTSAIFSHDSWCLLFFLASGLFLCPACAHHFSAVSNGDAVAFTPTLPPVDTSCSQATGTADLQVKTQGLSPVIRNGSSTVSSSSCDDKNLNVFIHQSPISSTMSVGLCCEDGMYDAHSAYIIKSLERLGYAGTRKGSTPSEHENTGVVTDPTVGGTIPAEHPSTETVTDFSTAYHVCQKEPLSKIGDGGCSVGNVAKDLAKFGRCLKVVSSHSVDKTNTLTDAIVVTPSTSHANCDIFDAGSEELLIEEGDVNCNMEETGEEASMFMFDSDVYGETATSQFVDEVDLLDEALGVTSASRTSDSSSDTAVKSMSQSRHCWYGPGCSSSCDNHASEGDHKGTSSTRVSSVHSRIRKLGQFHISQGHVPHGIEDLSLDSPCYKQFCRESSAALIGALHVSVHSWTSLSSLRLNMCKCFYTCHYIQDLKTALVTKIRQGTLTSVSLAARPDPHNAGVEWNCPMVEKFFWETLQTLASSEDSHSGHQPMRLLHIDVCDEQITFKDMSISLPGRKHFRGVQQLSVCDGLTFNGPETFSPLAQFIRRDHALSHVSLSRCGLDSVSCQLLLTALHGNEGGVLRHLNLCGVMESATSFQWEQICRLLTDRPSLSFLSLACCGITQDQVKSAEFIGAIKAHKTRRRLNLDLSGNPLGDAVWDLMSAAVGPQSSLTGLCFLMTHSRLRYGITAVNQILQQSATDQPVLEFCRLSASGCHALDREVKRTLQKVVQKVDLVFDDMLPDYLAMM